MQPKRYSCTNADLYALFAYRLPRLKVPLKLTWGQLQGQIGSECEPTALARKVRDILPTVLRAYPNAKVQAEPQQGRMPGHLILNPSPSAVPKTSVPGFRLVDGRGEVHPVDPS
jgi:hypothetical protein